MADTTTTPTTATTTTDDVTRTPPTAQAGCELSPFAIFSECPHCAGEMRPEHAHYRCSACGWRDSCCD
jgi:hypothetical protein